MWCKYPSKYYEVSELLEIGGRVAHVYGKEDGFLRIRINDSDWEYRRKVRESEARKVAEDFLKELLERNGPRIPITKTKCRDEVEDWFNRQWFGDN